MSLTAKLLLAFALVVATGVGVGAYLANRATEGEFQTYVATGGRMYTARVAGSLAGYYAPSGSWQGVGVLLQGLRRTSDDRLVLADASGLVVADTAGQWVGQSAGGVGLADPVPIVAEGRTVGQLYTPSLAVGGAGQGRGMGAGQGMGRGFRGGMTSPTSGPTPEESFQAAVSRSLVVSAGVAGALAFALGALASWQVVRPLRWLTRGAERIAAGDLEHRVKVGARDEVGQLARAFNSMAEALERDERARRNLLADVAHELRTPLTVIEGTADAILDGVFEPTPERIQAIKEESQLLAKTIADLRDLALAEAGQLALELAPADARELAERATRGARVLGGAKGVAVELATASDLPVSEPIEVDPDRILQVLGNLLGNAVRHTPPGGEVTLAVERRPGGILFAVEDTGEGISPEDLPHVLERFYRVDRSRSRQTGGSGLGLAIARQLVEAHGGRIWAESVPGQGSRFAFVLPTRSAPASRIRGGQSARA